MTETEPVFPTLDRIDRHSDHRIERPLDHALQTFNVIASNRRNDEIPSHLVGTIVNLDDDRPPSSLQGTNPGMQTVSDVINVHVRLQQRIQTVETRIQVAELRIKCFRIGKIRFRLDSEVDCPVVLSQRAKQHRVRPAIGHVSIERRYDALRLLLGYRVTSICTEGPQRRACSVNHVRDANGCKHLLRKTIPD